MHRTKAVLLVLLVPFLALPAAGQYAHDPPPPDASYWWTVSEELTPQELYAAVQSRERNQERLRQAIRAGHYDAIPESEIETLSLYIDGSYTPELWPMWDLFGSFAVRFAGHRRNYDDTARRELTERGMSAAGASQVVAMAQRARQQQERIRERLGERQVRFARQVVGPAQAALGEERAQRLLDRKDFAQLATVAGMAPQAVESLYRVWRRDPEAEAAVDSVERLRTVLGDEDWQILRDFLREEVAYGLNIDYFGRGGLR